MKIVNVVILVAVLVMVQLFAETVNRVNEARFGKVESKLKPAEANQLSLAEIGSCLVDMLVTLVLVGFIRGGENFSFMPMVMNIVIIVKAVLFVIMTIYKLVRFFKTKA